MNDDDALPFEMRRLPGSPGSSPPTLDHDTADRLLAGRLDPADAPPGFAAVAKVVTAATAPATPEELAGEPAAVAQFAAMARSGWRPRATTPTRRAGAPRRILGVRLAVAVLAAVLSIGGVAAATGVFPGPAKPPAGHGPAGTGGGGTPTTAAPGRTGAAATTQTEHARGGGTATGPDATGPARDGLCRAWQAGEGERNGRREDSRAFRALADAAGGADKIDAYCQATTPEHPEDKNKKAKEKGSSPSPGNGGSHRHGAGNGQDGPPPTTGRPAVP
jgi:hypothetical protein